MSSERPSTARKALSVNLDPRRYGSFAEIGAGQEVVRWFFRVGGAAGTIAKSMSAYDMSVSDAIYGTCERYVCRQRMEDMLNHEHSLNLKRLRESRGDSTAFFAFADTVSARNFHGTNECHGWMGIRFQAHPGQEDSQIMIHVRMLDTENSLQQEALGIVGVNLLYGAFFLNHEPDQLIESLLDNLSTRRIEIDMIEFSGDRVSTCRQSRDELATGSARLEQRRDVLGHGRGAAAFGSALQESDSGGTWQLSTADECQRRYASRRTSEVSKRSRRGSRQCRHVGGNHDAQPAIQRRNRLAGFPGPRRRACRMRNDRADFGLLRVLPSGRLLGSLHQEKDRHHDGCRQVSANLFDEKYYTQLDGGILESFGRLFKNDLKLYIYPLLNGISGELTTVENLQIAPEIRKLYQYLVDKGCIEQLDNHNPKHLTTFSREVLRMIEAGDSSWTEHVPAEVAEVIQQRGFFGCQSASATETTSVIAPAIVPTSTTAAAPMAQV